MKFEKFNNEDKGSNDASIAALEREKNAEMGALRLKFEKADTDKKRTKVAQEMVDLDNAYNREIEALGGGEKAKQETVIEANKVGVKEEEAVETGENKIELASQGFSLQEKAEAGLLVYPQALRDELEKLKQEIKADEKKFASDSRIVSEQELIIKENRIRKLEIILIDTENKIKNDYEKVGPNNVALIMSQEESIIKILKDLENNDLSLVPKARGLMHQWNVADSQDYFANEQKIKEALTIVLQTEKLEEKNSDSVNSLDDKVENLNSVGDVEEALQFNDDLSKNKKETEFSNPTSFSDSEAVKKDKVDLSMFDDMQKIAYFNEPSTKKENVSSDQEMENNVFQEELEDEILETEQNEGSQEKEDKKKRAGIFERIRGNKKLKWLVMALGLTAIGFGIFKGIDKKDDKKKDNTENKINTNDREEINPDDTIVLTPDDFANEHNEILKGLNPDVIDTINEEVGAISKIVTLEKGDGVGLINDYKMHNSYKVNFIDGETGAIHRDLAAISRTVQPNDLVIENVNGEIFVVCFYGIHDSGKTGYEGLTDNNIEPVSEADNSVLDDNIDQTIPQAGPEADVNDSISKNNIEIKTNITPKDSSESGIVSSDPDLDFKNIPVKDLTEDFIKYKQNQKDSVEIKKDSVETKVVTNENIDSTKKEIVPEKTKKNFFQRLFSPKEKKSEPKPEVGKPEVNKPSVSEKIKQNLSKTDKGVYFEEDDVTFGGFSSDNEPRSGLKYVERRLPGSDEKSSYRINQEAGLNSSNISVLGEDKMGDGIGPAGNPSIKENKKNAQVIPGKSKSKFFTPDNVAQKLKKSGINPDKIKFIPNEIKIDKENKSVVGQVVDSLKTVGVVETVIPQKDSVVTFPEVTKTTEAKTGPGYIMEKTEKRAEVVPGQIRATLTLKRVEGGWLVKNSNGTYSTVIIDDSLMPQFAKLAPGTEKVYVENYDETWSEVVFETGK